MAWVWPIITVSIMALFCILCLNLRRISQMLIECRLNSLSIAMIIMARWQVMLNQISPFGSMPNGTIPLLCSEVCKLWLKLCIHLAMWHILPMWFIRISWLNQLSTKLLFMTIVKRFGCDLLVRQTLKFLLWNNLIGVDSCVSTWIVSIGSLATCGRPRGVRSLLSPARCRAMWHSP